MRLAALGLAVSYLVALLAPCLPASSESAPTVARVPVAAIHAHAGAAQPGHGHAAAGPHVRREHGGREHAVEGGSEHGSGHAVAHGSGHAVAHGSTHASFRARARATASPPILRAPCPCGCQDRDSSAPSLRLGFATLPRLAGPSVPAPGGFDLQDAPLLPGEVLPLPPDPVPV